QKEDAPAQPNASKVTFADESEQEPHWSAAPQRAAALAEISSINRAFSSLKNTFTFPSGPLERLAGSDLPRLAYNSTNASIHAYEHALSELLSKLDGIESHGFKGVREARKQLVVKIERELEDLEKQIAERLAGSASPAVAATSIPIESASPITTTIEVSAPVVDTEMKDDTASKAPATEGYDVEFEEPVVSVSEPTPAVEVTVETPVEQPVTESNETAMDVKPTPEAPVETKEVEPTPIPTPSVFAEDATKETQVATQEPVEQVASVPAPAPVSEPTAEVLSDEDSEIEDA
ncbi:17026_t:CDS:1, partial [Acaulospora colombiana]